VYQVSAANPEATGRHNKIDRTHRNGQQGRTKTIDLKQMRFA
jgi:hypothetical protein